MYAIEYRENSSTVQIVYSKAAIAKREFPKLFGNTFTQKAAVVVNLATGMVEWEKLPGITNFRKCIF